MNDDDLDTHGPDELGDQLRELLGANEDVGERTVEHVDRRLRAGSTAALCVDLLSVGWTTFATMLTGSEARADGDPPAHGQGRGARHG